MWIASPRGPPRPAQTDKSRPNCDLQKPVTKGQSDVCKKSWGKKKPKGFTTHRHTRSNKAQRAYYTPTQTHKSHARQAWNVALTNGWHFWCISWWEQNLKKRRTPILGRVYKLFVLGVLFQQQLSSRCLEKPITSVFMGHLVLMYSI